MQDQAGLALIKWTNGLNAGGHTETEFAPGFASIPTISGRKDSGQTEPGSKESESTSESGQGSDARSWQDHERHLASDSDMSQTGPPRPNPRMGIGGNPNPGSRVRGTRE